MVGKIGNVKFIRIFLWWEHFVPLSGSATADRVSALFFGS